MTNGKKMYKVLSPIEKKGGGTYWMRIGTGYTNRDDSLNLYLDAIPPTNAKSNRYELQIRELTEEDLRKRDFGGSAQGSNGSGGYGASSNSSFSRDLGGIGGGPTHMSGSTASSRAVTSASHDGSSDSEDVPF